MPFRDAYKISGSLVGWCVQNDAVLEEIPLETLRTYSSLFDRDVYDAIALETCVAQRTSEGGPSPDSVRKQIELAKDKLEVLFS